MTDQIDDLPPEEQERVRSMISRPAPSSETIALREALQADLRKDRDAARRIAELEAALVAIIDAIDAKDSAALERAVFVGRGLTF